MSSSSGASGPPRWCAEIEALVPAVRAALERTRFGRDAVHKAEGVLARVRAAIAARDAAALAAEEEPLERTLQLFQGLAAAATAGPGRAERATSPSSSTAASRPTSRGA